MDLQLFGYSENSTYYFFSTAAQSIAAIAGLSAALATFRYQGLLRDIEEKAVHIQQGMREFVKYLWSDEEKLSYYKLTSTASRIKWLWVFVKPAYENDLSEAWQNQFRDVFRVHAVEKIQKFRDWRHEFAHYNALTDQARMFRAKLIQNSVFGLTMIFLGIIGTLLPVVNGFNYGGQFWAKLIFLILLLIYFVQTAKLVWAAFEKSWEAEIDMK